MTAQIIPFRPREKPKEEQEEAVIVDPTIEEELVQEDIVDLVLSELSDRGYDLETILIHQPKDVGLLIESVAAIVNRYSLKPHFLHTISDYIFDLNHNGEVVYNSESPIVIQPYKEIDDTT